MKQLTLTILSFLCCAFVSAQSCLPDGIILKNQADVDNFLINYPDCTEILGDLKIGEDDGVNSNINNLSPLSQITSIGGTLEIQFNTPLSSLNGLDNLTSIGNELYISSNPNLMTLAQLANLNSVQSITIFNNDNIQDLTGLEQITELDGLLSICYNDILSSMDALSNLVSVEDELRLVANPQLPDLIPLSNLTSVGGIVWIAYSEFSDLTGLENLTSIGRSLIIYGNDNLTNIDALSNLTYVKEAIEVAQNPSLLSLPTLSGIDSLETYLYILDNDALTSLEGLENLTYVGSGIGIEDNNALVNLNGLNGVTSIGAGPLGEYYLMFLKISDNNNLISTEGLNSLTFIGQYVEHVEIYNNPLLNDLTGISNIEVMPSVEIYDNPQLSACYVESVCNHISNDRMIDINNNLQGCNSVAEVESSCIALPIDVADTHHVGSRISLYPNPVKNTLYITDLNGHQVQNIIIFDANGRALQTSSPSSDAVDVSKLSKGIYIIQITIRGDVMYEKFVIK